MEQFIENMETLTDSIKDILEYTISEYGEYSDEYDFVERVYNMSKAITDELRKKGE